MLPRSCSLLWPMMPCETLLHCCHKALLSLGTRLIWRYLSLNSNQRLQCGSKAFRLSERKDSPALLLGQTTNNFVLSFLGFYFETALVIWEPKLTGFSWGFIVSLLSFAAGESPNAPLFLLSTSQMCHGPMGDSRGWAQPWIRRGAGRERCSLSFPHNDQFLGHFILSLYPWHPHMD